MKSEVVEQTIARRQTFIINCMKNRRELFSKRVWECVYNKMVDQRVRDQRKQEERQKTINGLSEIFITKSFGAWN